MKQIEFKDPTAAKIYKDYLKRIERMTKTLPETDRNDILMEFNSHIYESLQRGQHNPEVDTLVSCLEKLGAPEEVLTPMVADKKLTQATRTFNPLHVFRALALNITNGVSYFIFSILYLLLFTFVFLIFCKIVQPEHTGLFYNDRGLTGFGVSTESFGGHEVLGNWFIPVMIITIIGLYILITFMLRLKRKYLP